jgi:hypothetical protein
MYAVINKCSPNCCAAYCSSTLATPTQVVPLVLFTVQFSFTRPGHTQCQSLSLSPTFCIYRQFCSVHSKRYNISFKHFLHIDFALKYATQNSNLLDTVSTALHFVCLLFSAICFPLFFFHSGFPVPSWEL